MKWNIHLGLVFTICFQTSMKHNTSWIDYFRALLAALIEDLSCSASDQSINLDAYWCDFKEFAQTFLLLCSLSRNSTETEFGWWIMNSMYWNVICALFDFLMSLLKSPTSTGCYLMNVTEIESALSYNFRSSCKNNCYRTSFFQTHRMYLLENYFIMSFSITYRNFKS